ncbi:MAG: hypothetical protein IT350_18715 [Deltaproteobacteria bacterium]|nr:hypothetical protein [Deltaproteobacteria bacterium]
MTRIGQRLYPVVLALALVAALAGVANAEDTLPDINGSEVSIPWADFKLLREKLQGQTPTPPPPPPVAYALGRGTLTAKLDAGRLELTADYPLTVFGTDWVQCPLVPSSTPVADILLDGQTAPVNDNGGQIELVLKGPAAHKLTMRFEVDAPMRPGPGSVELGLPDAAGQVLRLTYGAKLSGVTIDGATMHDEKGLVTAVLTGDQLVVRYNVALDKAEGDAAAKEEKLPSKVLVDTSTLVSIDEGFVRAVVQLDYEVRHAPITEFTLAVPEGYEVVDVTGASIAGWRVDAATRMLIATIGYEVKGAYPLTVVLERSIEGEEFTVPFPALPAQGVERDRGHFAVQVTGGVEVTPANIKDLQPVDVKELPAGLAGGATNPIVLSYKYLRHPFSGELRVVRHQTQAVLGAAIDRANYIVQITEDGDCVVSAIYRVRNNRKQFLEVRLPEGEKTALWSSFVAGKPVKPSKTKEGAMLLPLEKSAGGNDESTGFDVEVIFYTQLPGHIRLAGTANLAMPLVDLPISQSYLTVYAPERFRFTRLGGSMRLWTQPVVIASPIAGDFESGEMAVPEAPAPAESGALGKLGGRAGRGYWDGDDSQKKAELNFQERLRAAQSAQDTGGALPTRFTIPKAGTELRYRELVTIGEASTLRLGFALSSVLESLKSLVWLLGLAGALALSWRVRTILSDSGQGLRRFAMFGAALASLAWLAGTTSGVVLGAVIGLGVVAARAFATWLAARRAQRAG